MRSSILISALLIGDALNPGNSSWINSSTVTVIAVVLILFFIMDITEFIKYLTKK